MEVEIWKDIDIEPFLGCYQVSNYGNIKSMDRLVWNPSNKSFSKIKGCVRIPDVKNKKYKMIGLAYNGKYRKFLIHRLVALIFLPNPENHPEVNHKDGNKLNNHYLNLEWCSHSYNIRHADITNLRKMPKGEANCRHILTEDAVKHIRKRELRNKDYCKLYNVHKSTISSIQNDLKRWSHVN